MTLNISDFNSLPSRTFTLNHAPTRIELDRQATAFQIINGGTLTIYVGRTPDANPESALISIPGGGTACTGGEGVLYAWADGPAVATVTSLITRIPRPGGRLAPIAHASLNTMNVGNDATGQTSWLWRHLYNAPRGVSVIQLVYPGFTNKFAPNDVDTPIANPMTVHAAVETFPGGTITSLTFGGALTGTVNPGVTLISDPVEVDLPPGNFFIRTWVQVSAGQTISCNGNSFGDPVYFPANCEGDQTNPTGINDVLAARNQYSYQPISVLGLPAAGSAFPQSLAAVGDSITVNSIEALNQNPTYFGLAGFATGWVARAVWGKFPLVALNHGSYSLANYVNGSGSSRRAALGSCDAALFELGINDLVAGKSFAQIQSLMLQAWTDAKAKSMKVIQSTILPDPLGGSLNFYTEQNRVAQTAQAWEANRRALNRWIRTENGGPLLDLALDLDRFVDPQETGFWPVAPNLFSGTAAASSTVGTPYWMAVVVDSGSPNWTPGQWANPPDGFGAYILYVYAGTGAGSWGTIWDNTANSITVQSFPSGPKPWVAALDATSKYVVVDAWSDSGIHPLPRAHAKFAKFALAELATIGLVA